MKWLMFLVIVICVSIIGIFATLALFYFSIEVFFYFFGGIPIPLDIEQFKKILKISIAGGSVFGGGVVLFRLFKVKGF